MPNPVLYETVGSSVRSQYAQREDGQWFRRSQESSRWGPRWTRWTATPEPPKAEWNDGVPGVSDGWYSYGVIRANQYAQVNVRLPKE